MAIGIGTLRHGIEAGENAPAYVERFVSARIYRAILHRLYRLHRILNPLPGQIAHADLRVGRLAMDLAGYAQAEA